MNKTPTDRESGRPLAAVDLADNFQELHHHARALEAVASLCQGHDAQATLARVNATQMQSLLKCLADGIISLLDCSASDAEELERSATGKLSPSLVALFKQAKAEGATQ